MKTSSTTFCAIIALLVCTLLVTFSTALSIQTLQTQTASLVPSATKFVPLQTTLSDFTIVSIDGDTYNFKDSNPATTDLPLLIYDADMVMSWTHPTDVAADDTFSITFIWCESETSCDASSRYIAYTAKCTDTDKDTLATATFVVPTLAFTKLFSSKVGIEFAYSRAGAETEVYTSKHKYPSDIATKTTKGVVTVVVVFCVVAVVMALAVLAYFVVKKCKKMRRTRHFPAAEHNFWRRK